MRIAQPVSGRPGVDVQVPLVAISVLYGVCTSRITHRTKLPGDFVDRIEITLAHFGAVPDHVSALIRVFGCTQTLPTVIRRIEPVGVENIERLDQESGNRLDLVV